MKVFESLLLFMCQFSFLVQTIATVCMFLAGKVEETPRPLKDVILVSYEIINKKDADAVQRIKQRVKQLGIIIIHLVSAPLTSEQFCFRQPWKWQSGGFGRFCLGHFQVVKHLGWRTGQLGSSYFGFRSLESKLSKVMGHFVFWLFQILGYSGFRLYIGSIGSETLVLCFGAALVWVSLGSGLVGLHAQIVPVRVGSGVVVLRKTFLARPVLAISGWLVCSLVYLKNTSCGLMTDLHESQNCVYWLQMLEHLKLCEDSVVVAAFYSTKKPKMFCIFILIIICLYLSFLFSSK